MRSLLAICLTLAAAPGWAADPADDTTSAPVRTDWVNWLDKLTVTGSLDAETRLRSKVDLSPELPEATSDLYLRQFSLGVEARLLRGASATIVLHTEWLGDSLNPGDPGLAIDEAHLDLEGGLNAAVGPRALPFGQFDSDLITDPITQDGYETRQVGATLGWQGPRRAEVTATLYKGTAQLDQLFQSGLFDTARVQRVAATHAQLGSYILAAQAEPWADRLTVFGAWLDEPGAGGRNRTANAAAALSLPRPLRLTVYLEGVRAVHREVYAALARPFHEGAYSAAASYSFVSRPGSGRGHRSYLGRRSSHRAHPIVATLRYEGFDDDGLAVAAGAWSARNRTSLGARRAFRDDGSVLAYLQVEGRRTTFRGPAWTGGSQKELYARLGTDF